MTKFKPLPTQAELHELFDYSVVTGELYWKKRTSNRIKLGDAVGCKTSKDGYKYTKVNGVRYSVHRLIWVWVTGEDFRELEIDHKNRDRKCNAWHNLRTASRSENQINTSGVKGYTFDTWSNRWQSKIKTNNKYLNLGRFDTEEEARAAYVKASKALHGEFSSVE